MPVLLPPESPKEQTQLSSPPVLLVPSTPQEVQVPLPPTNVIMDNSTATNVVPLDFPVGFKGVQYLFGLSGSWLASITLRSQLPSFLGRPSHLEISSLLDR